MKYEFPGIRFVPFQRPRFNKKQAFNTKRYTDFKKFVQNAVKAQGVTLLTGPVKMSCVFYFKRPKVFEKHLVDYPCKPCDVDNAAKGLFDSLNNVAYKDDCQIVEMHAKKLWGEDWGFTIEIEPL